MTLETDLDNMSTRPKVLLVDFNNFARYPTISIGYLASILRAASVEIAVFAPLMVGVKGTTREARSGSLSLFLASLNHRAATTSVSWIRHARDRLAARRLSGMTVHQRKVVKAVKDQIALVKPDAVMISTYLMYRNACEQICVLCRDESIPVLIGGPYFAQAEVISEWTGIPGLSGLIAGEVEMSLPSIVRTLLDRGDLGKHAGVFVADSEGRAKGQIAPPLTTLDSVPYPDYVDFPWNAYPNRIVPLITGRGCGWGVCTFCSDVTSSAGRTFRSRSPANVLDELRQHYQRLGVSRFVFTDLKLNSNIEMWRSIIAGMQRVAPGARWVGAVHVGREVDNGLKVADLRAAAESGCVRLTTGLESGSQRVGDMMKKGTRLDAISSFLQEASAAGISCRCTMIVGYPGEEVADVLESAEFLQRHMLEIERVSLNRLQVITGTTLHRSLQRAPQKFKGFAIVTEDGAMAQIAVRNDLTRTASHRKAVLRLLRAVHRINSRSLSQRGREFDGVM